MVFGIIEYCISSMKMKPSPAIHRKTLEDLYVCYNRREFVHPDPVEFLYDYDDLLDREIVGLIASTLAYGNVKQILKSVSSVLGRMQSPSEYLKGASLKSLRETFTDFKHRFTTGEELSSMLFGIKRVIESHGSLNACFSDGLNEGEDNVIPALSAFVHKLNGAAGNDLGYLIPSPVKGSACKRLNLFLRWMVRCDDVDPGGWSSVPASKLIIPLDTHMHRICLALGLTNLKQANMRTALEITYAFKRFNPEDPVKYDFALTRLGIRDDTDLDLFLKRCENTELVQHV